MRSLAVALSIGVAVILGPSASFAQHDHGAPEKLGRVHFETTCKPEVGTAFDRAVALLHSFSFSAAKQAFEDVLAKDASCAIAHWGVALTHWGNPFAGLKPAKAVAAGHAAIQKGLATGQPSARERDYLAAAGELFKDHETVDQRTRTIAYERAMERVHKTYPKDREAAIYYALAVNQTALASDKTYAQQLKTVAILEPLFKADPDHPGLAHYIIHAYDHPPLAPRALAAARRYAQIAPSAPHALHMPSHTFTRVGYWQESIDTNIRSAEAATRDGTFGEALHAMDYQVYAYLQTGQDRAALRVIQEEAPKALVKLDPNAMGGAAPGVAGLYAAAAIQARYAMERGAWADAAALRPQPTTFPFVDAVTRFARAVGAARSGTPGAAQADVAELKALHDKLLAIKDAEWAERVSVQQQAASAWIAFAEGRKDEAVAMLRKAADAEDAADKSAISPGPIAPAREMLGEMLLEVGKPAEALKEFEATLKKEPNRFRATYLAAKAAQQAGDRAAARKHFAELVEICKRGDTPGRPELAEARKARSS
jgi:tetratricopeptide (TPR) repeat protein